MHVDDHGNLIVLYPPEGEDDTGLIFRSEKQYEDFHLLATGDVKERVLRYVGQRVHVAGEVADDDNHYVRRLRVSEIAMSYPK